MINGKIVRALDVGYGNVKFVKKHEFIEDMVRCDMFPSKSPAATEGDIGEGTLKPRDTVFIEINKVRYEVGYDVTLAQGANDESGNFSKDFVRSDGYMARVLGALHYMFQSIEPDYIDTLVVGLPVNNMQAKHYLKDKLKTKHTLPNGREITIKDVRVFEQPLGAFFNFMYSAAARRIINLATLSIYLEKLPFKQGSELNEIRPTISSVPEPLILTPITPLLMDEEEEADLRGMFGNDS